MSLRLLQPLASSSCCFNPNADITSRRWRQTTPPGILKCQRAPQHAAALFPSSVFSARCSAIVSSSVKARDQQPTISAKECQRVEDLVQESLLRDLPRKYSKVDSQIKWAMFNVTVAFGVYKYLIEGPNKYNIFEELDSLEDKFWYIGLLLIIQLPLMSLFDVLQAYIELKLHERQCIEFCGKESIKD